MASSGSPRRTQRSRAKPSGRTSTGPVAPTPDALIFRTIFQTASVGLVHTDMGGRILDANPAFRRIVGLTADDLRAMSFDALTHPEDRLTAAPEFRRLVAGDAPSIELRQRYVRKDGTHVPTHASVSLSRDAEGRPLYVHVLVQDLGGRGPSALGPTEGDDLHEAIASVHDLLGDAFGVVDINQGRFVVVSDTLCRIYGYNRAELLALKDLSVLAAPEERALMNERLRTRKEGPSAADRYDLTGLRKDATRLALEVSARRTGNLLVLLLRDVSDRRRGERARAQFAAIVDSADLAIVGVSLEGNITGWNPAAQRIFGWTPDEMIGQTVTSLFPKDADQVRRAFQGALRGDSLHYETDGFRKDGGPFPAAVTVSPIRDSAGVVIGVSGIVRDESSRRRSEEALHDALSLYSATLESTADGVLVVDLQGTIRSFNRRFVDIWKIPAALLTDRDESEAMKFRSEHSKDPAAYIARLKEIYASPEKESHDLLDLKDGRVIERLSQPQRIGDRIVGRVWSYRDLTEKIWGERAVQLTRELALALTDTRGLTEALDVVLRRVGQATGWALGQAWTPVPSGDQLECSRAWFGASTLEAFHEDSRAVRFRVGQGLPGRVWATGKPIWVPDVRKDSQFPRAARAGQAGLGAGLAVPVLARDQVVAVLEFFVEEPRPEDPRLTQLVSAVASQLGAVVQKKHAEEALRQKSEELARMNQELEQFVYFASHDLREPLHVVLGYLQRLERRYRSGEPDFEPMWDYAVKGAVQMQDLIKDLLGYARIGKVPLAVHEVDLNHSFDQALTTLKWDIEENHAGVTRGDLPTVEADPRQIQQVFQNLLSNAVKFRRKKVKPRIHVEAIDEKDSVHITVKDNGVGIAKKDAERVFVIFQRLHTQEEYPGTGIGLSICKKIVENHGGRIWVESEPGVGSTFHFTLPKRAPATGATEAKP